MLTKGDSRFYSRNNAGKYPLDVSEIRTAFALSESLSDKIRRFREDRLAQIVADQTPVPLEQGPRVVLHVVPVSSFVAGVEVDLLIVGQHPDWVRLLHAGGWNRRHNFDGLVLFSADPPLVSTSYLQLFRNGILEAVDTYIVRGNSDAVELIPSAVLESALIDGLRKYLDLLRKWEFGVPIFVLLGLLDVKGSIMAPPDLLQKFPIDRDALILPEIVADNLDLDTSVMLKSAIDSIWQASGWPSSPNYQHGKWIRQYG
ncbi:hypothetical protein TFLX_02825 [Thermoflexales bacterium]|nr:hypothetical protein TFLX_02825 [Thermoflexales bacterium]